MTKHRTLPAADYLAELASRENGKSTEAEIAVIFGCPTAAELERPFVLVIRLARKYRFVGYIPHLPSGVPRWPLLLECAPTDLEAALELLELAKQRLRALIGDHAQSNVAQ